jgi:hypothetical protein
MDNSEIRRAIDIKFVEWLDIEVKDGVTMADRIYQLLASSSELDRQDILIIIKYAYTYGAATSAQIAIERFKNDPA